MVKIILADDSFVDLMVDALRNISDDQCLIFVKDDPKLPKPMELKYAIQKMEVYSMPERKKSSDQPWKKKWKR